MATSVPSVVPLSEIMWRLARVIELGMEDAKTTGDLTVLDEALGLARMLYEQKIKVRANEVGDHDYCERFRVTLEMCEDVLFAFKARQELNLW